MIHVREEPINIAISQNDCQNIPLIEESAGVGMKCLQLTVRILIAE